jgi:hypothetical protein
VQTKTVIDPIGKRRPSDNRLDESARKSETVWQLSVFRHQFDRLLMTPPSNLPAISIGISVAVMATGSFAHQKSNQCSEIDVCALTSGKVNFAGGMWMRETMPSSAPGIRSLCEHVRNPIEILKKPFIRS